MLILGCATPGYNKLKGSYYWGVEEEVFIPCSSGNAYWITGKDEILNPARERLQKVTREEKSQGSPIFVKVLALDKGPASDGFAMDYDSVYEILKIEILADKIPKECVTTKEVDNDERAVEP